MELHLLSSILWYDSAAYQLSLYIQWDPGRALKCQGLSMKRLCALYILKLHFLEDFAISVRYGFMDATAALRSGCLGLELLKRIPTLACLKYTCRAGHYGWMGRWLSCLLAVKLACSGILSGYALCPLFSWWYTLACETWQLRVRDSR